MQNKLFLAVIFVAALILVVQIITEIIKSMVSDKGKYNILVFVTSLIITVVAVIASAQILKFALTWYIIAGAIALSFFVAYGAMFGYDKLFKRLFDAIKEAIGIYKKVEGEKTNEKET